MATLPDKLTLEISRWLHTRPKVEAPTLSASRSMALASFCADTGRNPADVPMRRFNQAIVNCGWLVCQLRPALGKLLEGMPGVEPFKLREKPEREPPVRNRVSVFKIMHDDPTYKPTRRPSSHPWSSVRRKHDGLDRLDALMAQALDQLGVQAIGAPGYVQEECAIATGPTRGHARRAAIKRVLATGLLRREDFPTTRRGDWITRVGASLARVSGQKEPRGHPPLNCFVWWRVDRSHSWHYAHPSYRPRRVAAMAKLLGGPMAKSAVAMAIDAGIAQPYRRRPRQSEVAKAVNAKRNVQAVLDEMGKPENMPDSVLEFHAVRDAAAEKPMTKAELRAAAKAERERLRQEKAQREEAARVAKLAERQRIEQERFQVRAEAEGRRVLAAERKRVSDMGGANAGRAGADCDAFSRDF